jgi:hypothetical protein
LQNRQHMQCKYIVFSLIMIFCGLLNNCKTIKNKSETLFNVKDAYYQSWVARKQENGTDIMIILVNVQKEIKFDSIIFRGIQLPVWTSENNGVITLKSMLTSGLEKIPTKKKLVHKPDQLLYYHQGARQIFLLNNIRRLDTVYK